MDYQRISLPIYKYQKSKLFFSFISQKFFAMSNIPSYCISSFYMFCRVFMSLQFKLTTKGPWRHICSVIKTFPLYSSTWLALFIMSPTASWARILVLCIRFVNYKLTWSDMPLYAIVIVYACEIHKLIR